MDVEINRTQLIAIEYPGTVLNVDNMMKTFGGEKQLTATFKDPTKRLELRFRPEDPYCKWTHGDRFTSTSIVIEVVRRKKKSKSESPSTSEQEQYKAKLLGIVEGTYKFKSLCDFQILPVLYNKDGTYEDLLPKIVPTGIHPASWLDEKVPLFIPASMFSRFDSPQGGFVDLQTRTPRAPQPENSNTNRKKRQSYAVFNTFENPEISNEPVPELLAELSLHPLQVEMKKKVEEIFLERPIWTRNGIIAKLKCDRARIKFALPSVAYYFTNGPWRTLWVKFGYDPRKEPESKIYQIMDFRVNSGIKIEETIANKKRTATYYSLPSKVSQKSSVRVPLINTVDLLSQSEETAQEPSVSESVDSKPSHILLPERLPSNKQCYFQLCDIYIDEVQKLIHQNDGREQFCHEKDGWCDVGILDKCREIIAKKIKRTATEQGKM